MTKILFIQCDYLNNVLYYGLLILYYGFILYYGRFIIINLLLTFIILLPPVNFGHTNRSIMALLYNGKNYMGFGAFIIIFGLVIYGYYTSPDKRYIAISTHYYYHKHHFSTYSDYISRFILITYPDFILLFFLGYSRK